MKATERSITVPCVCIRRAIASYGFPGPGISPLRLNSTFMQEQTNG